MADFTWATVENGFTYSANSSNDSTQSASFTISGSSVIDTDSDGIPDNITVDANDSTNSLNISATLAGFDNVSIESDNNVVIMFEGNGIINYTGTATNDSTKSGSFVIETNGNDAFKIDRVVWSNGAVGGYYGALIAVSGLNGSISINGDDIGILGDDSYNISYVENYLRQVLGISDGASLSNHDSLLNEYITEENVKIHIDAGTFRWINSSTLFQIMPVEIVTDKSLDLTAVDGKLASITGLANGYNLTLFNRELDYVPNIPNGLDAVTFGTEGSGILEIGSSTISISGDKEFTIEFDESGEISELVDFYGMIAGSDTLQIDGEIYSLSSDMILAGKNYFSAEKSGLNIDGNILRDGITYLFLTSDTAQTATIGSENADAEISIQSDSASLTAVNDDNFDLTFSAGTEISEWNVTLNSGDDSINIDNITSGIFNGGAGEDIFRVSSLLSGNVTITGGSEDANTFYAQTATVSSASEQNKITITDVDFNLEDVLSIDAGIENLTKDFFGDGKFFNYATADQASTSGIYAKNIFDASELVSSLNMSFSMVKMLDDSNMITNVVWTNSKSSTINFSNQDDDILIFSDTNNRADVVSLSGDYDDTIHVGKNDTINLGSGDDVIMGWDSTNVLILDAVPENVLMSGSDLVFESDSSNVTISAVNSTVDAVINDSRYLIGNSSNNVLTAGNTSTTLWGNGGNDTLIGGTGNDVFRFTASDDNITIRNADSNDIIDLSDWSFDGLKNYRFNDNGIILSMGANQSLNIVGTNLTDMQFSNSTHVIDFSNRRIN